MKCWVGTSSRASSNTHFGPIKLSTAMETMSPPAQQNRIRAAASAFWPPSVWLSTPPPMQEIIAGRPYPMLIKLLI